MSYSIIGNNSVNVDATEDVGLNVSITNTTSLAGYAQLVGEDPNNIFKSSKPPIWSDLKKAKIMILTLLIKMKRYL